MKIQALIVTCLATVSLTATCALPASATGPTLPHRDTTLVRDGGGFNDHGGGGFNDGDVDYHPETTAAFKTCLDRSEIGSPWLIPSAQLTKQQFSGMPAAIMGCYIPGWYQGWPKLRGELDPSVDRELISSIAPYSQVNPDSHRNATMCSIWPFSVVVIACQKR